LLLKDSCKPGLRQIFVDSNRVGYLYRVNYSNEDEKDDKKGVAQHSVRSGHAFGKDI
jgi:hypothetical protein